jgi:hypothetical protein
MEAAYYVGGIDVHKKMHAVGVANAGERERHFECRRFGTTISELRNLAAWLQGRTVQEVGRESTAQYWKTGVAGAGGRVSALAGTGTIEPRPTRPQDRLP